MQDFWTTVGLSALVATIFTGLISFWSVNRAIRQRVVIEERQKWRDSLRTVVPQLVNSPDPKARISLRDEIALRLNPIKDSAALRLMDQYILTNSRNDAEMLIAHFQWMLKHDWERSKLEAGWWPWNAEVRAAARIRRQENRSPLVPQSPVGPPRNTQLS